MDVRLGRPDSQPELEELNATANSNASSRSAKSETHAEPEAEVSTSASTDMEIVAGDRRVRFREQRDSPRTSSGFILGTESRWWNRVGKRKDEPRPVVPSHSSESSSSELSQVSAAAASDTPTGERLYVSMIEEGPSGDCKQDDDAT